MIWHRLFAGLALSAVATLVWSPQPLAASDAPMYHRTSYRGAPDLKLALALVVAGGGPKHFDAAKLVGVLAGASTPEEVRSLTARYGAANVASFLKTFTYAIDDTLRLVAVDKVALPSQPEPNPADGGKLAASLYGAGLLPDGRYDVGHMIERTISHGLHVQLMHDIDGNPAYGHVANANFHVILAQAVLDLKDEYGI